MFNEEKEIFDTVTKINIQLEKSLNKDDDYIFNQYTIQLTLEYNDVIKIKYLGQIIWKDYNDERELINGKHEPLEDYLKRKMSEIHKMIKSIKNL